MRDGSVRSLTGCVLVRKDLVSLRNSCGLNTSANTKSYTRCSSSLNCTCRLSTSISTICRRLAQMKNMFLTP